MADRTRGKSRKAFSALEQLETGYVKFVESEKP